MKTQEDPRAQKKQDLGTPWGLGHPEPSAPRGQASKWEGGGARAAWRIRIRRPPRRGGPWRVEPGALFFVFFEPFRIVSRGHHPCRRPLSRMLFFRSYAFYGLSKNAKNGQIARDVLNFWILGSSWAILGHLGCHLKTRGCRKPKIEDVSSEMAVLRGPRRCQRPKIEDVSSEMAVF